MTREFRIADIVQKDELAKSAERNVPKTPGRLVKLKPTESAEADNAANQSDEDTKVSFNEDKDEKSDDVACVGEARAASPVIAESEQTAHTGTIATQCDEPVDNQSGDGSDQAERESGEEDNTMMDSMPMVLPTLSHIDSRVCQSPELKHEVVSPVPVTTQKKNKEPQFEEESKVHEEEPLSTEEADPEESKIEATETAKKEN